MRKATELPASLAHLAALVRANLVEQVQIEEAA